MTDRTSRHFGVNSILSDGINNKRQWMNTGNTECITVQVSAVKKQIFRNLLYTESNSKCGTTGTRVPVATDSTPVLLYFTVLKSYDSTVLRVLLFGLELDAAL